MQKQDKRTQNSDCCCIVLLRIIFLHRDSNFLNLVDSKVGSRAESSDDGLGVESLLHVRLELLQEFSCKEGDRGGAIPNLNLKKKTTKRNTDLSCETPAVIIVYLYANEKTA